MNLDSIKAALTRKLGPLPAWAWAGIAAVGFYIYQRRSGSSNGSNANTAAQNASLANVPGPFGQFPDGGGGSPGGGGDGSGGGSSDGSGAGTSAPGATTPDDVSATPAGTSPTGMGPAGPSAPKAAANTKAQHNPKKGTPGGVTKGISGKKAGIKAVPRSSSTIHKGIAARGVRAVPKVTKVSRQRPTSSAKAAPAVHKTKAPPAAKKKTAAKRKVIKR